MVKIKKLLFSTLFALIVTPIFAENAEIKKRVNAKYDEELTSKGVVKDYRDDGLSDFIMMPETFYEGIINQSKVEKADKNYPFVYESLYCIAKKDLLVSSKSSASKIDIQDVARVVRSVSKMEGMYYYSTTKKKDCVLYSKCYMVDGENSDKKIADENKGSADGQISYCMQDDHSFGVNHYKLFYYQKENQLLCQFKITDVMGLGPFKAIYPGKMVINILVEDCGEDLLLYISTDIDSVKFPGIKGQITDSMTSRMDAIYKWFITQF